MHYSFLCSTLFRYTKIEGDLESGVGESGGKFEGIGRDGLREATDYAVELLQKYAKATNIGTGLLSR